MQWILAAQKFGFVDFVDFLGFLDFLGDLATPMKLNGTQTIHFLMLKRLLVGIVWIHGITPSFCGIGLVVFGHPRLKVPHNFQSVHSHRHPPKLINCHFCFFDDVVRLPLDFLRRHQWKLLHRHCCW